MIFGPLPIFDLPWCMDIRRQAYNAHLRRKARETIGKEETMPTLLGDLDLLFCRDAMLSDRLRARNAIKAFIEANQPWLPPQQEGFGPWIEWKPGDPGPRVTDTIHVLLVSERAARTFDASDAGSAQTRWQNQNTVAYCVKLEPTNE